MPTGKTKNFILEQYHAVCNECGGKGCKKCHEGWACTGTGCNKCAMGWKLGESNERGSTKR